MKTKLLIISLIIIAAIIGFIYAKKLADKQIDRLKTIISTNETIINLSASSVKQWELKYSDLENAYEKKESERSHFEQIAAKAYKEIEKYKRKEKDLIGYTTFDIEAKDTVYLEMPADCAKLEPIGTEHITIEFHYDLNDNLNRINYNYRANVNTIVMLSPKKKQNGKKHFPNWGFIWGFDTNSLTSINDKNAVINNQVSIQFVK